MIGWRFEVTIERPASEIWALAADVGRHSDWMGAAGSLVSGDQTQVGARVAYSLRLGPFSFDPLAEVSIADPGRRLGWRIIGGAPFTAEYTLDLEPVGPSTTRATWSGTMQPRGVWRLLTPLFAMEAREGEAKELRRLKALAEGRSSVGSTVSPGEGGEAGDR